MDSGGGWHTVLNDTDSYIEASIAAFAVDMFARAVQRSWLEPEIYLSSDRIRDEFPAAPLAGRWPARRRLL